MVTTKVVPMLKSNYYKFYFHDTSNKRDILNDKCSLQKVLNSIKPLSFGIFFNYEIAIIGTIFLVDKK